MVRLVRKKLGMELSKTLARILPNFAGNRLKNPFFIIGWGRSGTSMFHRWLASHEDIAAYPDEANEMWHPRAFPWRYSNLELPPFGADPYIFTQISLKQRLPRDDKRIRATFGAYQLIAGGQCFLNKSVMISFMIPYVLKIFPEGRFIHLVRDGRAVILSHAKRQRAFIERTPEIYKKRGYDFTYEILLKNYAKCWNEQMLEVETQVEELGLWDRGVFCELRYEDFCANPRECLSFIATFMGLDPDGFQRRDYSHVNNANYKFQNELDQATLDKVTQIMESTLRAKGYPTKVEK